MNLSFVTYFGCIDLTSSFLNFDTETETRPSPLQFAPDYTTTFANTFPFIGCLSGKPILISVKYSMHLIFLFCCFVIRVL